MSSFFAASFAFFRSRDAIAAISLHSPFCIPGITFFVAIDATPSTPHFTLSCFTILPSVSLPTFIMPLCLLQLFHCHLESAWSLPESRLQRSNTHRNALSWLLSSRLRLAPSAGSRERKPKENKTHARSEERRVGKECRYRWAQDM